MFLGLENRLVDKNTLTPEYLEGVLCQCFGLNHVGSSNYYADGYAGDIQVSIKTRKLNPILLKTQTGKDFQSHPDVFLGPHENKKQNIWVGGLELIQRRSAIECNGISDEIILPEIIGEQVLSEFMSNIDKSNTRFNTKTPYELICSHGYSADNENYIMSLFWQEYILPDYSNITWSRGKDRIFGYVTKDSRQYKIIERVNGNAKREATCFKEFKDLRNYKNSLHISVPVPKKIVYDQTSILTRIQQLRQENDERRLLIGQ